MQALSYTLCFERETKIKTKQRGLRKTGWDVKYLTMITKKSVGLSI